MKLSKLDPLAIGKLSVKILITLKYGTDTYLRAVSSGSPWYLALLDVLVIDGFFSTMWILSAYGGTGAKAMSLRPIAALAAWIMYVAMFAIAGASGEIVDLVARVTGAIALAVDTYDVIWDWWKRWKANRPEKVEETIQAKWLKYRASAWKSSYRLGLVLTKPYLWYLATIRVVEDLRVDREVINHLTEGVNETRVPTGQETFQLSAGQVKGEDKDWGWTCKECGEVREGYKSQGMAEGALKNHMRFKHKIEVTA